MDIFALSALATGVVALTFGGLVFLKDTRRKSNFLFFLMSLSVSVWGISYWYWLSQAQNQKIVFTSILVLTAGSMAASLFFTHWVLVLTKANTIFWKVLNGISYVLVLGFFLILVVYPSLIIGGLTPKLLFPLWPSAGPLYIEYIIGAYLVPILIAFIRIFQQILENNKDTNRGQLFSILIGALLGFGGTATNFFLWFNIPILPYGNFPAILFAPILGYSIIRYHLFTLRTVATELLVLFTVTGVFVQIFLAPTLTNLILQIIFFIAISISSYLLLRSVYKGEKTRYQLEELTKQLKSANTRLKELDQQKSEFLSIATHQLRGPLAGIRGHLSLLLEGSYGVIPEKAKNTIQKIFASSGTLAQTITDFLNVSRIEQGSMQYDMVDFSISDLVVDIANDLNPLAAERKLKLTIDNRADAVTDRVHADRTKISHIFFNLIDNAIKYTEKGWIKVTILTRDSGIRVEVSDSGVGIEADQIDGLFQKFVRARGASGVNVNGTGLGLYVARQMVEAHKGKIWAESDGKGKGSTFVVELPAVK